MKKCRVLWNKIWCHVGMGRFHRSHQSTCIDMIRKLGDKENTDWSIVGVGLSRQDKSTIYNLRNQNHCYTLKEVSNDHSKVSFIKSIKDTIYVPNEKEKMNVLLTDELKGLSMTITEDGYHMDTNHTLRLSNDVRYDLSIIKHYRPYTIYGFLHYLLYHRFLLKLSGIYIMSCDNIIQNSRLLQNGFLQFLELAYINEIHRKDYLSWVQDEITFPITMVDRITPNVCNREEIYTQHGFDDRCNVTSEIYLKWAIEDRFITNTGYKLDFPPLNLLDGVVIDKNIDVHQKMKLKFVNGGHLIIAFYGMMNDCVFVVDAMKHNECHKWLDAYFNEIYHTFSDEERETYDIKTYMKNVKYRFENKHILDTIERLCLQGGTKVKYVMSDIVYENNKDIDISKPIYIPIRLYFDYLNSMKDRRDFLMKYDLIGMKLLDRMIKDEDKL